MAVSPREIDISPKKFCVFTGAGIGVPLGLPTTGGFINTIKKIPNDLKSQIGSYLKGSDDIEKILYLLEGFVREDDFTTHIIKEGLKGDDRFGVVLDNLIHYKERAKDSILQIKADIYELLEDYDPNDAFLLYSAIIDEIKNTFSDSSISFFTTNYDLTFENGFADDDDKLEGMGIKDIYYGFEGKRKVAYKLSQKFNWETDIIEYKKLHGSLDWGIDNKGNCIKTGINNKPKNPEDMPMLYPGFKGVPSKQPFIDLHDTFNERISEADVLIVIGFAFRDQYLNSLFDFSLKRNKNLTVLCYNPCELNLLPDDSELPRFVKSYSDTFKYLQEGVELNKVSPLNLSKHLKKTILGFS